MTLAELLVSWAASGVLGMAASRMQEYLAGHWGWLANLDKEMKFVVQLGLTILLSGALYGVLLVMQYAAPPADWRDVVEQVGGFVLVAITASQVHYQARRG